MMNFRSIIVSSYEKYLEAEYPTIASPESSKARDADIEERGERLARFPHALTLELSYPELDFANRWCWSQFGPADGQCLESYSEYPACTIPHNHSHVGVWMWYWLAKTGYDFGFNEWYFVEESHRDRLLEEVPNFQQGHGYPR